MKLRIASAIVGFLSFVLPLAAQTAGGSFASAQVPPVIQFSNLATDAAGSPLSGSVALTFSLYNNARGGEPLWTETQNVQLDSSGHYSVYLGITKTAGMPISLFSTGQAHWLGVQPQGQPEQPRVFLVSVPYAMKAGDAATIGGLPPSAFVLAAPVSANPPNDGSNAVAGSNAGTTAAVVGSGTTDFVPLWTANSILGNSVLFQSGSGSTATVGINTTTPGATLDVNGSVISRGALQLPSTGTATAGGGFNSQPFSLQGSAFNSGTGKAIGPLFQWQTEPSGNNTSNPAGTLNLLYGTGSGSPTETGLNIASSGKITFATGQTFPGAGTITGVNTPSGSGLTGGGTSGTLNLALTNTCAANQILQWTGSAWACTTISGGGTITGVTAGTDLTGGGTSGTVTLNVDTTKVPRLAANNTFTGTQTINNTTVISGTNTAGVLQVTNTATSNNAPAIVGTTNSTNASGIKGVASATTGGVNGVFGTTSSTSGYGVRGTSPNVGVYGISTGADGYGVEGTSPDVGVYGNATGSGGIGVFATGSFAGAFGSSGGTSLLNAGLQGSVTATSGTAGGVVGTTQSVADGFGVEGRSGALSNTGQAWLDSGGGTGAAVWGDGGLTALAVGLLATVDDDTAALFENNSSFFHTLFLQNNGPGGGCFGCARVPPGVLVTEGGPGGSGKCTIDVNGDVGCTGKLGADATVDGGARKVSLYAVQSPGNWFEDFGSGTLTNGVATVTLDPTFAQTVNTTADYHVFLTPNGDCKGLYVSQKSTGSFEVRELGGGQSSVRFDYRIVARRNGYENVRLADVTEKYRNLEMQHVRRRERTGYDPQTSVGVTKPY